MSEKISEQSIRSWMEKRQGWAYRGGALVKQFHFKSFRDTIVFVNRIASLADEASQYPEIQIQGGQVRLTLASRAAGVTQKDLELAQAIDFATSAR
jgi:pterin-4a-carbinolamine dehydratase